jgi:uncharacterized repeat protein (TIGR03803 family)
LSDSLQSASGSWHRWFLELNRVIFLRINRRATEESSPAKYEAPLPPVSATFDLLFVPSFSITLWPGRTHPLVSPSNRMLAILKTQRLISLSVLWIAAGMCTPAVSGSEASYAVLHSFGATSSAKAPVSTLVEDNAGVLYGASSGGGLYGKGTLFRLNRDGTGLRDIYDFQTNTPSYLHFGQDGRLYVTTSSDGTNGCGTVFRINVDGSSPEILHRFGEIAGDGKNPLAPVIEADGFLWGTTSKGGSIWSGGTVFKMAADGTGYQVIWNFNGNSTDPWGPAGAVLDGGDGWLYGTTEGGGTNFNWGTAYRLAKDGSSAQLLHSFTSNTGTGAGMPIGTLLTDDNGFLWGVTDSIIFRMNRTGSAFQFIACFTSLNSAGYGPRGGMVKGSDGLFYGLTQYGGNYTQGTLYRFRPSTFTVTWLISFGSQERNPNYELLAASDGYMYGTTSENFLGGPNRVFRFDANASQKATIVEFGITDQLVSPRGGVVETAGGTLLGLATSGGANNAGGVYSVDPASSNYQSLALLSITGGGPYLNYGPLLMASDGYIYGTSASGGTSGNGTVFQMDASGSWLQPLWTFSSGATDGRILYAGLTEGADGYLYGATATGGSGTNGTVFRITKSGGDFTILHHFGVLAQDGKRPRAGLWADADGWFYGTTELGGLAATGTVYRIQADGNYQVLHHFTGSTNDGCRPYGDLIRATNGFLYGTCREGGLTGDGTLFRISSDGTSYAVVHAFNNAQNEGRYPQSRLIPAGSEGLYGVTTAGGTSNGGTLFRIGLDGSYFTILHAFGSVTGDGNEPNPLTATQDGALTGATRLGGKWNKGTVFRVLPLTIEPLAARVFPTLNSGQLRLNIRGRPNTTYWIEASTNLGQGTWSMISTQVQTTVLGHAMVVEPAPASPRFYRAATSLP